MNHNDHDFVFQGNEEQVVESLVQLHGLEGLQELDTGGLASQVNAMGGVIPG